MQNRIRELREERGMNQDALAGLVGVSQQKISKVERNTESLGIDPSGVLYIFNAQFRG